MGFWIYLLCMDLLIPLSMLGFGLLFLKRPPKDINGIFGYRTTRSMKNQDAWDFAHRYCGKLWFRWGLALLPLSLLPLLLVVGKENDTVGTVGTAVCLLQLVPLIGSVFPTERALKRTFDEDGNRK